MKDKKPGEERLRGWYFPYNNLEKMHREFVRESPLNRRSVPTYTVYRKIIVALFKAIFTEIILNGYEFHFRKLGKFYCAKYLPYVTFSKNGKVITNKNMNFAETYKIRKETGNHKLVIYYDNRDTGGYIFKIQWDLSHTHFVNKTLYKFKLEKQLQVQFNAAINSGQARARIITKTPNV